jgi:hypothetical protein
VAAWVAALEINSGSAQFLPCLALTATNTPPAPPPGTNFLLQALDASGAVLQTIQFALEPGLIEENDPNQVADFFVPFTADPSLHTFQLSHNGALLGALTASAHAPTVTLTTPNGGQSFAAGTVTVAWSGSDADGDALTYTVQYSPDGGSTWDTLAVDWPGQTLGIDSSELAASTNGLMRVLAGDGFNTTAVQSAATFTVQPHAPTVSINAPADGSVFTGHQQLFLDAGAADPQDGALGGTNVQWRSDRDGALGTGAILSFEAGSLSEGHHTITVTATDSAGLTNRAVTHLVALQYAPPQLGIHVLAPSALLSWPSYYTNYVLQSSADPAAGWTAVTNPAPVVFGSQNIQRPPLSKQGSFFRLLLKL